MSVFGRSVSNGKILVEYENDDIFDTLNEPIMQSIQTGLLDDTHENRINAALCCIYSLTKQLHKEQQEMRELKGRMAQLNQQLLTLETRVMYSTNTN